MARRRVQSSQRRRRKSYDRDHGRSAPWWQWLLGLLIVAGFGYFLYFLNQEAPPPSNPNPTSDKAPAQTAEKEGLEKIESRPKPRFSFYTMLPEKEVIVPEGEIKTRQRQERLGRAKPGKYMIQAGSFQSFQDADRLKAQLALLGVEAKIEAAKIRGTQWYRVRIGPFEQIREVQRVRANLRKNQIDSVVQTASK